MELGITLSTNIHNTGSLIRTLKYVLDISQTEEAFTVAKYKHTHTSVSIQWTTTLFFVASFNACWTIIVSASPLTKACLNLDILGFSYILTRPLTFAKSAISEVMVCFIIGKYVGLRILWGYQTMTCVVHAPVVSSLWSKLLAMNWRKHSIDSSSDNVSVNSIVDTLAYFSKSNKAEYDNESPNVYRTSTRTRDLVFWWASKPIASKSGDWYPSFKHSCMITWAMVTFRKFFFSWAVSVLDFVNIASRKYDNFFGMRAERFSRVRSLDKDNILHVHCFHANIVQSLGQRKRSLSNLSQRYNY